MVQGNGLQNRTAAGSNPAVSSIITNNLSEETFLEKIEYDKECRAIPDGHS